MHSLSYLRTSLATLNTPGLSCDDKIRNKVKVYLASIENSGINSWHENGFARQNLQKIEYLKIFTIFQNKSLKIKTRYLLDYLF